MKKYLSICAIMALCLYVALPVVTEEKADKSADRVTAALEKMKELEPQTKCPMSGGPITEGKGVAYEGHFIGTCCDNCAKKVEADPLSAILKVRQSGQQVALAEGFAYAETCPLSGQPVNPAMAAVKNNALLSFCCANCKGKYESDSEAVMKTVTEKKIAPIIITLEQTQCPVMDEAANPEVTLVYKGKEIALCCADCKAAFQSKPDEYMQAMADQGIVLKNAE